MKVLRQSGLLTYVYMIRRANRGSAYTLYQDDCVFTLIALLALLDTYFTSIHVVATLRAGPHLDTMIYTRDGHAYEKYQRDMEHPAP